nr:Ger(x)C family spore germination protein [Clostridium ganghwense]
MIVLGLTLLFIPNERKQPVENLGVEIAAGFDVEEIFKNNYIYEITRNVVLYSGQNKEFTENYSGVGDTIGETREERSNKTEKTILQGMEKIYLVSEKQAEVGIKNLIDIISRNPYVNDTGKFVVCEGKAKEFFEYKIPGYNSIVNYIDGLIESSSNDNFVDKNFSVTDILVRVNGEGKNVVMPYISIGKNGIHIGGFAIFKGEKMVKKINMKDAKIMNLLRGRKTRGIITIQKDSEHYLDLSTISRKKVKCYKKDDKMVFDINLKLKGQVLTNELHKKLYEDVKVVKQVEGESEKELEKQCNDFIYKMKKDIKTDCLELGRYAAAKFGRRTGTDWNKVVQDSEININVSVDIVNFGRGDY